MTRSRHGRRGFTLFEVILAIALASVLLTLIGTAINMYLGQVDSGRTRVEEAQLARSILSMIAEDIRTTSIYKPQDTSSVSQLMAKTAAASFDVDSVDKASELVGASKTGSTSSGTASTGSSTASTGSSSSTGGSTDQSENDATLPLGISGSATELYVDSTRLPRQEELFSTGTTGYSNAQSPGAGGGLGSTSSISGGVPATDVKTVHYYIRPGEAVEAGSASVTSLDPNSQARVGGLVRQEIPRAMRNFAETSGGSDVLESNAVLLAPEVVQMQLRYFDGSQTVDTWDMKTLKSLPLAIEVRIWLRSPNAIAEAIDPNMDPAALASTTHEYRQVVSVPMAPIANASKNSSATDSSSTDSSSTGDASTGNGATSGDGSAFGTE